MFLLPGTTFTSLIYFCFYAKHLQFLHKHKSDYHLVRMYFDAPRSKKTINKLMNQLCCQILKYS